MKIKLTKKQKQLLDIGRRTGHITIKDFIIIFASPISRKANLERFIAMGILKETNIPGRFIYINNIYKD